MTMDTWINGAICSITLDQSSVGLWIRRCFVLNYLRISPQLAQREFNWAGTDSGTIALRLKSRE